jgi:hypothetical protein
MAPFLSHAIKPFHELHNHTLYEALYQELPDILLIKKLVFKGSSYVYNYKTFGFWSTDVQYLVQQQCVIIAIFWCICEMVPYMVYMHMPV